MNAISPTYLKTLRGHTAAVIDLSLSEDGRHAISCSEDQTIRMWDIRRGKCIKVFTGMVGAAFSFFVTVAVDVCSFLLPVPFVLHPFFISVTLLHGFLTHAAIE